MEGPLRRNRGCGAMSKKDFRGVAPALAGLSRVAGAPETLDIAVADLKENPRNVRTQFSDAGLDELAASIQEKGLIEPLIVVPNDDGTYLLLAGHRRRRAALLAGVLTLPAIVRRDIDPDDHEKIALIENLQREDLGPMDIATGLRAALDIDERRNGEHGSRSRLARAIGKSPAYVTRYLALMDLPQDVQQLARDGTVVDPQRLARLGMLDDEARVDELSRILNPSSAAVAQESGQKASKSRKTPAETDPNIAALERRFSEHLATTVSIVTKRTGGELRISFTDLDVFDGLVARLGLPTDSN